LPSPGKRTPRRPPRATLNLEATADSKPLILNAIRTAYRPPAITALKFKIGTTAVNFLLENAVINLMRCSGAPDDALAVSLDLMGLTETEAAAVDPVALSSELLPAGGASVTVGGSPYDCEGFEITVGNACEFRYDLDAKALDSKRLPTLLKFGQERISLSVQMRDQIPWDVDADTPVTNIAAIIIYTDGVTTITFTFANLSHSGARVMPLERDDGVVIWPYDFIGKPGSLVIT